MTLYDIGYILTGVVIAICGIMKINDLKQCHSIWYRYAYILATIGGGCMPFRAYYPHQFADWPALLVIVGAAMIVSHDKRRPLKEFNK